VIGLELVIGAGLGCSVSFRVRVNVRVPKTNR